MNCRVCDAKTKRFLDLGKQPIANQFVKDHDSEIFYHLEVYFCPKCYSVQIGECPAPSKVFTGIYPFYTSSSKLMERHFEDLSAMIKRALLSNDASFVVEIGSNDGTFLKHFKNLKHLGVEPSTSVADEAIKKGLNVIKEFFNEDCATNIINENGQAKVIVSANTFSQIQDRKSVLMGVKKLLTSDGIWINEEPYLGDIIFNTAWDQFYNEHVFYSSVASYDKITKMFGLEVIGLQFFANIHGGSTRYYIAHEEKNPQRRETVEGILKKENLSTFEVFENFENKVESSSKRFKKELMEIKKNRGEIVGYAATAKSSTILNYCKIDKNIIKCIYDTTPAKHNTYSPGMHIPVVSYDRFKKDKNINAVLFAWNHKEEIYNKEKESNINWILPI